MSRPRSGNYSAASPSAASSRFELLERIGVGGIAEIHRARLLGANGFSRIVALKVLKPELAKEHSHRERFGMEARIGAVLNHPNIAAVYEFVELDGRPAIVMEHIDGTDLLSLLSTVTQLRRRVPPELAVHIAIEVAHGLDYAHNASTASAGVPGADRLVHGDVSPANIMLSETGHVKLIDFGIAEAGGVDAGPRNFRGKLGYVSPEVVLGRESDARSDVFSLAIVLWEMLTLKRLFKADDDLETLRNVAEVRIESRFARHDYIAPPLLDVIACALARDPAQRFRSADGFARALMRWLSEVGMRPSAALLSELLRDIRSFPLTPPALPGDETEPPQVPATNLDLSGLEAVLAEIETKASTPTLDQLVRGQWVSPFDSPLPPNDGKVWAELDPWVLAAVLVRLAVKETTGALMVTDGLRTKSCFFERGRLVHVASNVASELLGKHLTSIGVVSQEHATRGLELSHAKGMRLGDALVALRAISAERLADALEEHMAARLCDLMSWSQGKLCLELRKKTPLAQAARPHDLMPLVARGIRQAFSPRRAFAVLEPFTARRMQWLAEPREISERLALSRLETDALVEARSLATVGDALINGAGPHAMALLIAAQVELLRFHDA